MGTNFRNSAGTDLDDLFGVANNNVGFIGFRTSDGQDLGNRYNSGSLGFGIGYKDSAGTDIGFIRGKAIQSATISVNVGSNRTSMAGYSSSAPAFGSISPTTAFGSTIVLINSDIVHVTDGVTGKTGAFARIGFADTKLQGKTIRITLPNGQSATVVLNRTLVNGSYGVSTDTPIDYNSFFKSY